MERIANRGAEIAALRDTLLAEQKQERLGRPRRLALIGAALARLDSGAFGVCEACGQQIPVRRLHAVPWTTLCVSCQEELERCGGVPDA